MNPVAVYVHTPFCPSKCGYCDFNSYAMSGDIVDRTVDAIRTEILRSPWKGVPAKTIFFGGGTPTFLSAPQLNGLLEAVMQVHPPIPGAEITSEANPGTVDMPKFDAMRQAGFNRLSLGAQSFVPEDLVRLGRVHQSGEIGRAVAAARAAGFENINIDLMFALPGQSLAAWRRNLALALALQTEHLSLYCLTIEPNTRFHKLHLRGMLDLPEDDTQVEMYEEAMTQAEQAGLLPYEISNFCKPGRQCEHNLAYWRNEDYAAYGPGAVGCMNGIRYTVLKHPERYSATVETGATSAWESPLWCEKERLTEEDRKLERLMMGLRLAEGLNVDGLELDASELKRLTRLGWIEHAPPTLRLTRAGRHFCSEVALALG